MKWTRMLGMLAFAVQLSFAANPVPQISQPLVPVSVRPGSSDFTLTVNGANFVNGAMVEWNGSSRVTTFVSSTQVTARILASDVAMAGTATVQVINGAPGQPLSNPVYFPIVLPLAKQFYAQTNALSVNGNPFVLTTADMNNDGIVDLVLCRELSGKVSVFLGQGGGTFAAPHDYLVQGACVSLVVGDFNGDHNLDVAASNEFQVNVLLGRGDGTLTRPVPYNVGGQFPQTVVEGDFNQDGVLDLATANSDTNTVSVLIGKGDGTFLPHVDYPVDATAFGLATGDFNGDGILDMVVTNKTSNEVSILLGVGDGTFGTATPFNGGVNPAGVAVADFNGDGKLDLVVSDLNPTAYPISVLLGNGDGTFQTRRGFPSTGIGVPQVGDMNGDGIVDIVMANQSGPIVLLGKGDGSFQKGIFFSTLSAGAVALADFNGDGRLDMAVGGLASGKVPILLQTTVALTPPTINFGQQTVGTSMMMNTTLTNFGPTDVSLTKISVTGANAKDFKPSNNCGKTLTAGSTCTITITFTPSAKGTRFANLSVASSVPGPAVTSLSGVGI